MVSIDNRTIFWYTNGGLSMAWSAATADVKEKGTTAMKILEIMLITLLTVPIFLLGGHFFLRLCKEAVAKGKKKA